MHPDEFTAAIGRTHTTDDVIDLDRARALWASLETGEGEPRAGDALPALWHWLYFWEVTPRSGLAPDGHAELGGFLPPLGDVRRMWAGSRVAFHAPLRIGEKVRRVTTLSSITRKNGRSGPLTFVELTHEIVAGDEIAITDVQDLVYREPSPVRAAPRAEELAPDAGARIERWNADPVLLFRYSALTFNGHRIHYDAPYATGDEGYSGLVVHGPLIATLMAGAAMRHRNEATLSSFEFRMLGPIFGGDPFSVHVEDAAENASVFVRDRNGALASSGTARFMR